MIAGRSSPLEPKQNVLEQDSGLTVRLQRDLDLIRALLNESGLDGVFKIRIRLLA